MQRKSRRSTIPRGGYDGFRLFHAERQPLRKQYALLEPVRRRHHRRSAATPTSSACIRPGSASITSIRSAYCPARTWCLPMSPPIPRASGSRRRSRCCRCIIRSASPSNGRRSIFSPAAVSISPAGAATTSANTSRSMCRSTITRASSKKGLELVRRLWAADDRISHHGKHYSFDDVRITPKPVQRPLPTYVGSFSKPSIELAARLDCGLIVAPFAAAHELWRPQAGRRSLS